MPICRWYAFDEAQFVRRAVLELDPTRTRSTTLFPR